jgi:CRP-like cAMP-binding protein
MSMKKCYLAFEIGSMQKTIYPLFGPTTIGRSADNTITLPDPTTSRNHAKVNFVDGVWTVEDLGSANGIICGGKRVERAILKSGDTFRIGGVTFRFIEKDFVEGSDQLFETVEILTAAAKEQHTSGFDMGGEAKEEEKGEETKPWSERLQDAVAAIPFFSPLDEKDRKELADTATLHVFDSGEIIIREGDPGRSIYVILEGWVRVFTKDHYGEELELAALGASQFFGEMSFLTGKPRSGSVAAIDTSVVIELSYNNMRKVVKAHPTVKKVLLEYYNKRMGSTEKKRAEVEKKDPRADSRGKIRLPIKLVVLPKTTPTGKVKPSSWEAVSVDVSTTGIVVAVPALSADAFHVESEVRLEIELPERWGEIRSLGIIHRVKPAMTDKKMILVGIKYVGMADADNKKLSEFLSGA